MSGDNGIMSTLVIPGNGMMAVGGIYGQCGHLYRLVRVSVDLEASFNMADCHESNAVMCRHCVDTVLLWVVIEA
jgi:hypothetical protein